jgi:hypothetical protein
VDTQVLFQQVVDRVIAQALPELGAVVWRGELGQTRRIELGNRHQQCCRGFRQLQQLSVVERRARVGVETILQWTCDFNEPLQRFDNADGLPDPIER